MRCDNCEKLRGMARILPARLCGHDAGRGGIKYCTACSDKKGVCENCGVKLRTKGRRKPPATSSPLCATCSGRAFNCAMGNATECGHRTSSRGFKWCHDCALKQGVCENCGSPLAEPAEDPADQDDQPPPPPRPKKRRGRRAK